jgi:NADH-ubiquinone oxidoreductase chain 1
MTEHGASIFVFFFLGEYSSLILMSSFMAIFFLGGHHCPDLHKLILDPFLYIYSYYSSSDFSLYLQLFPNLSNEVIPVDLYGNNQIIYTEI